MLNPYLQDKVVVVTGANSPLGIGAAIARAFAAQGAKLFLTYYRAPLPAHIDPLHADQPGEAQHAVAVAHDASAVLQSIDGPALAWEADLSDPASIPTLFDRAEAAFGSVDVLVNNAVYWEPDTFLTTNADLVNDHVGTWLSTPLPTLSARGIDAMFAVNTRATALLMAEFARRHVQRGKAWGRVINISTDGAVAFPSEVTYGASKWAVEAYSRSAALELGQYGITVNVISPGPIQTGWITPVLEQQITAHTPLGRVGHPQDIADVAVFLASEQARWVTGQVIHVNGGHQ